MTTGGQIHFFLFFSPGRSPFAKKMEIAAGTRKSPLRESVAAPRGVLREPLNVRFPQFPAGASDSSFGFPFFLVPSCPTKKSGAWVPCRPRVPNPDQGWDAVPLTLTPALITSQTKMGSRRPGNPKTNSTYTNWVNNYCESMARPGHPQFRSRPAPPPGPQVPPPPPPWSRLTPLGLETYSGIMTTWAKQTRACVPWGGQGKILPPKHDSLVLPFTQNHQSLFFFSSRGTLLFRSV